MGLPDHEKCLALNANSRLGKDTKLDGRTAVLGSFSTKGANYSPWNKERCGRLGTSNGKRCQFGSMVLRRRCVPDDTGGTE